MKRCAELTTTYIPFDIMPLEVFKMIHDNLTDADRSALSKVDTSMLRDCSSFVKAICFLPPKNYSVYSEDIYQRLLERFPNIRKLTFKSRYRCGSNISNEKQIQALITFLANNKDRHPLSLVEEMDIQEIEWKDMLNPCNPKDSAHIAYIKELNRSFLDALSHDKLKSVVWRTFSDSTILSGQEIQPILDNAIDLTALQFEGTLYFQKLNLSFQNQSNLVSAKFTHDLNMEDSTITSLSLCKNLETLSFGCDPANSEDLINSIENNFLKIHGFVSKMRTLHRMQMTFFSSSNQTPKLI